jgi:hypothetical protein
VASRRSASAFSNSRKHLGPKTPPVGIEALSAGLSEPRDAIEDIIELYLGRGLISAQP